jgi:hypothetical protein
MKHQLYYPTAAFRCWSRTSWLEQAVLHTDDTTKFHDIIAVARRDRLPARIRAPPPTMPLAST